MESAALIAAGIADRIAQLPAQDSRNLVAIAGPPASGKSTVAQTLLTELNRRNTPAGLVPMDGFHLDNSILDARGLRERKGAPETFDLSGFASLLRRLKTEDEVIAPTFDRLRDVSVGSSAVISPEMTTVIIEGNYLLLDEPGWCQLCANWSFSVMLSPPQTVLEQRLIERWLDHGFAKPEAIEKARSNDLPNAVRVLEGSRKADYTPIY